jgi:hypothetical protein
MQPSLWFTVSRKAVELWLTKLKFRLKAVFSARCDGRARVLVLEAFRRAVASCGALLCSPRKQFWRLMGEVIGMDLASLEYGRRLEALLAAHVGLWDVVQSAAREGSLDGNIRGHRANPLREITSACRSSVRSASTAELPRGLGGKALAVRTT